MTDAIMQLLFGADERKHTALGRAKAQSITLYDLIQMYQVEEYSIS